MVLILPNPGVPANGQPLDATPLAANQNAITQAIQSFDGSQIQAGTIASAALPPSINPVTRGNEIIANFVYSGFIISTSASLVSSITGGVAYIAGARFNFVGVGSQTFTASKDTYVDVDVNGNVYLVVVANGATAGMPLTANTIRVAKVITSGTAVTSVVQLSFDPLGNFIYNTNSNPITLGYAQITSNFSTSSVGAVYINGLGVTVVVPSGGRRIKISCFCSDVYSSGASGYNALIIYSGNSVGTLSTQIGRAQANVGINNQTHMFVMATILLPAGSISFSLAMSASSGTLNGEASGTYPAFILVEAI
jgi:hypothetical protein